MVWLHNRRKFLPRLCYIDWHGGCSGYETRDHGGAEMAQNTVCQEHAEFAFLIQVT